MTSTTGNDLRAMARAIAQARTERPSVPLALATLVAVDGSSYRQPGARLLVDAESRVLGGAISGGCLEGDVAARAHEVCESGVSVLLRYDLREDLETIWGFGAGCDGVAHLLLEPLDAATWLLDAVARSDARETGAIVTVIADDKGRLRAGTHVLTQSYSNSNDAHPGVDAALMHASRDLVEVAQRTARAQFGEIVLDGNTTSVFVEPIVAPFALHIIGAGRGAEAFASIATTLGWQVSVIDHRPALLDALVLPATVHRYVRRAEDGLRDMADDQRTAVALLTHIFEIDTQWLHEILPRSTTYVGVLGSRERASRLVERLDQDGMVVTPQMRSRLFAPIGLDLGGESPEAIALAAIAEIESVLHGRPGGPLRERRSSIHSRTPTPVSHEHESTLTRGSSSLAHAEVDAVIDQCALPLDNRS